MLLFFKFLVLDNEEPKVGSQKCKPNPLEQKQRGKPLWGEDEMGKTFLTSHHYGGERKAMCTTGNKCLSVSQLLLSQTGDGITEWGNDNQCLPTGTHVCKVFQFPRTVLLQPKSLRGSGWNVNSTSADVEVPSCIPTCLTSFQLMPKLLFPGLYFE